MTFKPGDLVADRRKELELGLVLAVKDAVKGEVDSVIQILVCVIDSGLHHSAMVTHMWGSSLTIVLRRDKT